MNKGDGLFKARSCSVTQMPFRAIGVSEPVYKKEAEDRRDRAFGEALRAATFYGGCEVWPGAEDRTRDILEHSYNVMLARQCPFTPEDFAVYFLSRLVDRVDALHRERFRLGAAEYLLAKRSRLSSEIASLAQEARESLETGSAEERRMENSLLSEVPGSPVECQFEAEMSTDEFVFDRAGDSSVLLLTERLAEAQSR